MTVKEFIENCVLHNTLIRLWYHTLPGTSGQHIEVIDGDKPMMEHELIKSEYADKTICGVTDILYIGSHYVEAVNLVIER